MKILLIDDSTLSRNLLKRAIGEEHQFYEASDGMSGLEQYFLEKPDLVVLDLTMPGSTGLEILQQLCSLDPNARVIIGTADIQDETRDQALAAGARAFVTKPFSVDALQQAIQQVIEE